MKEPLVDSSDDTLSEVVKKRQKMVDEETKLNPVPASSPTRIPNSDANGLLQSMSPSVSSSSSAPGFVMDHDKDSKLTQVLDNLAGEVSYIKRILLRLYSLQSGNTNITTTSAPAVTELSNFPFPVDSDEMWNKLEQYLGDPDERIRLKNLLVGHFCHPKLERVFKRMLDCCIHPNYAVKVSYTGANGKRSFRTSRLAKVIDNVILDKCTQYDNALVRFDEYVKKYFQSSKDRTLLRSRPNSVLRSSARARRPGYRAETSSSGDDEED